MLSWPPILRKVLNGNTTLKRGRYFGQSGGSRSKSLYYLNFFYSFLIVVHIYDCTLFLFFYNRSVSAIHTRGLVLLSMAVSLPGPAQKHCASTFWKSTLIHQTIITHSLVLQALTQPQLVDFLLLWFQLNARDQRQM